MKIQKSICFIAGLLLVLFSYWLGKHGNLIVKSANPTVASESWGYNDIVFVPDEPHYIFADGSPADRRLLMDKRFGSYKTLKDPDDPSKGWGPTVIVRSSSSQDLLIARQQRAASQIGRYNAEQALLENQRYQDDRYWAQAESEAQRQQPGRFLRWVGRW